MLDIKVIKKQYAEDVAKTITDYTSLKRVMRNEIDKLRKDCALKEKTIEIKGTIEWLRARNRLSEIALGLTIVSIVLSIIAVILAQYEEKYGEAYLRICICSMTVLVLISAVISICTFKAHKKDCGLLEYSVIMLEMIQEAIDNETSPPVKIGETEQTEKKRETRKCKRYCRFCCCQENKM